MSGPWRVRTIDCPACSSRLAILRERIWRCLSCGAECRPAFPPPDGCDDVPA